MRGRAISMTADSTGERNDAVTETDKIASWIVTGWYEHHWSYDYHTYHIAGETYRLLDEDGYKALGEDPDDDDLPLILRRDSDGQCFEVELDATVWPTSREERDAGRAMYERMRKQHGADPAKAGGQ